MAFFFTVTLIASLIAMALILGLKRWELTTGRTLGGRVRPALNARIHRALVWTEDVMPALAREWTRGSLRYVEVMLHRLAALCVLVVERTLERVLTLLRHKTTVKHSDTEASPFLREVSAHKKQLLKATRKQRAIYDE